MSRQLHIAAVIFACLLAAPAALMAADAVDARVESVVIPTFKLGPADPTPAVFDLEDSYSAYPRSMIDIASRARTPVDQQYEMVVLENALIRVEVLPEVGGHVWRIIDKANGKNLLWTNDAIKPVRVGRRRGWLAGGIEFPFPVGNHGGDTMEPYRWKLRSNADGSATVTVSSFDHYYRFWSSYDITVSPDDARMAITVRLYNPTDVRNRYQIWINAAVHTTDDMQFIFPVDYVTGHGFRGVFTWPSWDDSADRSFWRNQRNSLGVFAWDADFLGAYYHDDDYGIIRYAHRNLTEGIKLWTWGTNSSWLREYSIAMGAYGEIQGGRWPTQDMHGWLEPRQMDTWTEYWYPVKGLGGVTQASQYAAMKVAIDAPGDVPATARIKLNLLRPLSGRLVVSSARGVHLDRKVDAPAGALIDETLDVSSLGPDGVFNVSLFDDSRLCLISQDAQINHQRGPAPQDPPNVRVEGEGPVWTEFAAALDLELNQGRLGDARAAYEALLARDDAFVPAWKALGILRYKQLDYSAALAALGTAVELAPADAEARYYLGLAQLATGASDALATLRSVGGDVTFTHAAKIVLAREALKSGEAALARSILADAAKGWSNDPVMHDYAAVAARLAGDAAAAGQSLDAALAAEPLDAFAMVERLFASGGATPEAIAQAIGQDFNLYLETALFYRSVGLSAEALAVAQAGLHRADSGLYYYYLSQLALEADDSALTAQYAAKAGEMGTDYVFPHRAEAFEVLAAVSARGDGGYPEFHQGTLLYWLGRQDDATRLWESLIGRYQLPGLYRNVARAYTEGRIVRVVMGAMEVYRKAIEEDPNDPQLYYALDDIYAQSRGETNRDRRELLRKGRQLFPEDDLLALRMVIYHAGRREFSEGRKILESHTWKRAHQSSEHMRLGTRAIVETYTGLAMEAQRNGNGTAALEHLKSAADARETLMKWFD